MFRLLRPALLSLLAFPSLLLAQVSVLDPQFGAGGQLFRPEFGAGYRPMGACPHPSGSITVVGSNIVGTQIEVVITRVLPNGELDTAFSGDGIHRLPGLALNLTSNVAAACSGLGTPEPSDDRLTLFTSTNYAVQSFQVDLDLGQ